MNIESATQVLTSLQSTPDQVQNVISCLIDLLTKDNSQFIRLEIASSGILQALLGILRCSEDIPLLTTAAQCLACIAHGCDDVRLQLAKLKVVKVLLPLLVPRKLGAESLTYEREWEWVSVQEQVLSALRKVTYLCNENQTVLAQLGGIGQIVKLCHEDTRITYCYPPETKKRLESLVVNQVLIGAVAAIPKEEKTKMMSYFPVLSLLGDIDYPMYYADLANENKEWLTDTLVKEGLALPDATLFPSTVDISWIIVRGSHVSGPNLVWLEYSVDKTSHRVLEMYDSLRKLPPPPRLPLSSLTVGSVYAIYSSLDKQWYRGWCLQHPTTSEHTFFCMDCGFSLTVPLNHVTSVPEQCRGVPPQAVPCLLVGLRPPPKSYYILENTAAILRNLAFEKDSFRKEIKIVGGVQLLLQLICCIDERVREQALVALLNLTHSKEVCWLLRQLGIIQILLDLVISGGHNSVDIQQSLAILQNLMIFDTVPCLEIFDTFQGYSQLKEWADAGGCPSDTKQFVKRLLLTAERLKKGHGPEQTTVQSTLLAVQKGAELHNKQDFKFNKTPSESLPTASTPCSKQTLSQSKSPVYRIPSQPRRSLSSDESSYHLSNQLRRSLSLSSMDEYLCPSSCLVLGSCPLYSGMILQVNPNESVQYIEVLSQSEISSGHILRSLCAIANEEQGGSIYIGVKEDGSIQGIKLKRIARDFIRLEVDNMTSRLEPPLDEYRYNIYFISVINGTDKELYIIKIEVLPSVINEPHRVCVKKENGRCYEECYGHINGRSVKLNLLEVRDIVASREIQKYEKMLTLNSN